VTEESALKKAGTPADGAAVTVLLAATGVLAAYLLVRRGGLWGEGDTYAFTALAESLLRSKALIPASGAYPHGYGYQFLLVSLSATTGLSLSSLQLYASGFLTAWLVLPAWLLYRELTSTGRGATLATAILLIQPEFLFPVMRGSHEKFTRGLMLLLLFLLVRSLRARERLRGFAAMVVAFYLTAFALIAYNTLMATSFIAATGMALLAGWLALRRGGNRQEMSSTVRRLGYAVSISAGLALTFVLFVYTPARQNLLLLQSIGDKLAALFLDVEAATRAQPYASLLSGWVSLPVYLVVSLANWLLLGVSALVWLGQLVRWLRGRWQPGQPQVLAWAFYAAFALITGASIVVDRLGTSAGNNFQLRSFPAFAMLAAPLVAGWALEPEQTRRPAGRLARAALWPVMAVLTVLSVLKFTNEPLLSNQWLFYTPGEMNAVYWADDHLANRSVWTGYDGRLTAAAGILSIDSPLAVRLDGWSVDSSTRDLILSDAIRELGRRLDDPLPVEGDSLITYDNGQAQVYHLRPRTPYQR
jgi:hypothetical protein